MANQEKVEQAVYQLLEALGENPEREGLLDTPKRVAKMYAEMFSGLNEDPKDQFTAVFSEVHDEVVLVKDIPFYSMCEHHLLPFFGTVDVAYVPDGEIIGLSKVPRLVDWASRRPSVQENLTHLIADEMQRIVHPKGLAVNVTARHMCMEMRGINQPGTQTNTSIYRDLLKTDTFLRDSFARRVSQR